MSKHSRLPPRSSSGRFRKPKHRKTSGKKGGKLRISVPKVPKVRMPRIR